MQPRTTYSLALLAGIFACSFSIALLLAPPVDREPNIELALETFVERYPEAVVNDIRMTQDEMLARSFEIDYRDKASGKLGRLNVHYVSRAEGKWQLQPELPAQLP